MKIYTKIPKCIKFRTDLKGGDIVDYLRTFKDDLVVTYNKQKDITKIRLYDYKFEASGYNVTYFEVHKILTNGLIKLGGENGK